MTLDSLSRCLIRVTLESVPTFLCATTIMKLQNFAVAYYVNSKLPTYAMMVIGAKCLEQIFSFIDYQTRQVCPFFTSLKDTFLEEHIYTVLQMFTQFCLFIM